MTKSEGRNRRSHNSEHLDIRASDFFRHSSFAIQQLMQSGSWSLCMREKRRRAFHEPAVPERGSVTRRTWGCSDALRLTEPRSHRVVRFMVPMRAKLGVEATH